MALTKKYRLIWDPDTKTLIYDPEYEYTPGSRTWVGSSRNYYETDSLSDAKSYVTNNTLIKKQLLA